MVKLSKETHLEMFTKMERIREFDSRINKLVRRGFVQGMTHFSVGEEAANVGAVQHLSYDDIFFFKSPWSRTIYRPRHGFE